MRTERNASVQTGVATSTIISEEKTTARRIVLEINNTNAVGGADVFVSANEESKANTGRRIQPGQTISWSLDSAYKPTQKRITAYSAADTTLAIYEEIED